MTSSPGAYVLIVSVPEGKLVTVGSLGEMDLGPGYYLYCGSAQGGLLPRLARHMRREKKVHWHVDRLTAAGEACGALVFDGGKEAECVLAGLLASLPGVDPVGKGFGSSDCLCPTHLFRLRPEMPLEAVLEMLRRSFERCRASPSYLSDKGQ